MKRYGYLLVAGLLCLGAVAYAQEQEIEDYIQVVTAFLQQETGKKPEPQEVLDTLNKVISGLYQKGDYFTSQTIAEQAYHFAEQKLGSEDPNTLAIASNLALVYQTQALYKEAEALYKRVLEASEKALDPNHRNTLTIVNNLAGVYQAKAHYEEAESLYKQALAGREEVLGSEHPDTLTTVNNLAELYRVRARYEKAEPLHQRALTGRTKVLGPDHPDTLISVSNLASLYQDQGRYGKAEPLHQRALTGSEKVPGPEHPDTLTNVNNLAGLYRVQGRYGEAEPLYLRALTDSEKVLGPNHPDTLTTVNNLAGLYRAQGRYREAEPLYLRTLAASKKVPGPEHPDTLTKFNNLAGLYRTQGHYGEAEQIYKRVLAANEKALGSEHPNTLLSVSNLAGLYQAQEHYGEAELLYLRALAASEKVLGSEHPNTLLSVNNLAGLYGAQRRYQEAEPLFQRALAASEKVLGSEHPFTLTVQFNYTITLINLKQPKRALQMLERMEPRLLKRAALELRHTRQESVRRLFLTGQTDFKDVILTLALNHPEPDFLNLAAKVMLRWKQIQGEEEAFVARLVRRRSGQDAEIRESARQIADLRRDLSHLANLSDPDADLLHKKLNELEAKEIRLAQISREFNRHLQVRGTNVEDVRHSLPHNGSALLELRAYRPANFKTGELGEPHWAALLLPAKGEMSLHDLGPVATTQELARKLRENHMCADAIDRLPHDLGPIAETPELVRKLRENHMCADAIDRLLHDLGPIVETPELVRKLRETLAHDARATAAALYINLFGKLDEKLKRYDPLYIAPDGYLSLLAFAELVTPAGRYWVQRQTLRQISVGRHLISSENRDSIKLKGLVALGAVDYDKFSNTESTMPKEKSVQVDQKWRCAERSSSKGGAFDHLEETGDEVTEVDHRYWNDSNIPSQIWRGIDASEPRLKSLSTSPSVLHLATHGFFRRDDERLIKNTANRPMVLSGLALAGANQGLKGKAGPDGEDGILYALEVQDLNLDDTELVTLSACDTGQGTLDDSEGVYGLTRAFRIAGARNILMSLWRLDDCAAREFMARFYRTWLNGPKPKDLAVALRETQLFFIQNEDESLRDPRVWAPFVLIEGRGL